jgi:hypothetical protein
MGGLEGHNRLLAGKAVVFKSDLLLLQKPNSPKPPGAWVIWQIHAKKPNWIQKRLNHDIHTRGDLFTVTTPVRGRGWGPTHGVALSRSSLAFLLQAGLELS